MGLWQEGTEHVPERMHLGAGCGDRGENASFKLHSSETESVSYIHMCATVPRHTNLRNEIDMH